MDNIRFFPHLYKFLCVSEIFHMLGIISYFTFFFYLTWRNVHVIKNLGKHFKITA